MKKIALLFKVAVAAAALVAFALPAGAMDVDEIVGKANLASYYGGDDGKARAKMVIRSANGQERSREFTILRLDKEDGGDQFFYIYFHKPGDVKKTVFMVHKKVGGDDDRWLYLPALDLVKRIGATDKRTSFVGAHYFYEDVSGRGTAEDVHVLAEETETTYILDNTPKKPDEVEFASYRLWVDKATWLPMKAEYKDKSGEVYRIVEALEVETVDGIPTVMKSRVQDVESGGETVMTFSKVSYNVGLKESLFTERYLRKPPRKHIRR
jgi:outer membrane lipoprotein-sorting protein